MKIRILIILVLLLTACGESVVSPGEPETDTVDLSDAPADGLEQLRVRADGITIWAEPQVVAANDWLFKARSSHTLVEVSAVVGDQDVDAKLVSARKFEVSMTANQLEANLAETPLLVQLKTKSGLDFTVMMVARARFQNTTGSSKIYPWKNIEPIVIARKRVLRGRVTTDESIVALAGSNDDDSEPEVAQEDATHWTLDWYPGLLAWAAHPTEDALDIVADTADGKRYRRWSPIHMQVVKLGVTNEPAADAWPAPACAPQVTECLSDFNVDTDDLEACGSTAEVEPCLVDVPVDDTPRWIQRFAGDLRSAIIAHYRQYEADIVASGGNKRTEALLIVDSSDIEELTDQDDVPSGHSLDDYRVFTHPDVTFPGSDTVWYGVYDRATGSRVEVSSFN